MNGLRNGVTSMLELLTVFGLKPYQFCVTKVGFGALRASIVLLYLVACGSDETQFSGAQETTPLPEEETFIEEDGTRIINNQLIRAKAALQRRQEIQNLPVDQFKLPTDVLSFFMQTTEVITGDPVGWRASGLGPTYRISRDFVMPDGLSVTLTAKEVAPEEINLIPTVTYNNIQGEYENMQPTNATDSKIIRIFLESNGYMEDVDGAFADAPNSLIAFEAATNTDLPNQGFLWQGFAQLDGVKGGQDLSKGWITIYNEDGEIFLKFKPQYDPARYNAIWKNIEKRNVPNEIKIDEETITATQRFRLYFRRGLIGTIGLLLFVKYADKQNWLTRLPVIGHKFDPNGNIDSYLNSKFENRNKVDYKPQDISLENFKANFDSVHHMIVSKGNGIIWLEEHQMWKGRFNVFWNSLEDSYEYFEIYRELVELEKSGQTLSQEQIDEKNAAFQFIKNNGKPLTNFALSKDEIAKVYSKADINIATRLMDWTYAVSSGITFFLTIPFLGSPADVMLALLGAWGAVDGGFASWFDAQKSIAEKTAKDAIKNLLNFEVENSVLIADDAFEHLETSFVRFDKRFEKIASQYGKRLKKENKVFSEFKKMWEGIFPEEKGEKDPYLALLPAFFSRQSGSRIKNFSGFKAPKSGVKRFNGKVSTSILTEPIILRSSPATRLFKSSDAYRQYRKDINKKQFDFNDYGWPSPEGLLFTYRSTKRLKNGEILYLLDALPETEAYLQSYFLDKGLKKILTTRSQFYVLPEDVQMHFYNEKIIEE